MSRQSVPTRATLLELVRSSSDAEAWRRFEATYREMLLRFCRSAGLQFADTEDAVQIVFTKLVTGLQRFEYDPAKGRFRDYLFRCARSAIADLRRCPIPTEDAVVLEVNAPQADDPGLATLFENEWTGHHYRMAVASLHASTDARSVQVFDALLAGKSIRDVAGEFSLSEAAAYKVQERMRERLRQRILEQVREENRGGG
jgi:RNA polymerase sigma-70 factor (ECF subfamily)